MDYSPHVADRSTSLFAHVMMLVASTLAVFGAAAYLGRNISSGMALLCLILAIVCAFATGFVREDNSPLALGALFGLGAFMGLGSGPLLLSYAHLANGPQIISEAGLGTALIVSLMGSIGYATTRDLSAWLRPLFWALAALIVFGLVTLFIHIPGANLIYVLAGLGIFSIYTLVDFNLIRNRGDDFGAVWLAAGIFLDVINIFFLLLNLLANDDD